MAVVLAGLVAGLAANAVSDYVGVVHAGQARAATLWAAQAQLQRCQAGAPLESLPPTGTVDADITLKTARVPGEGQWSGLHCITVTAETHANGQPIQARVIGYAMAEGRP